MIASENYTSQAVMEAVGSVMTNKYAEGYPKARYYGGCENSDIVEQLAIDRAKKLFKVDHANVQPHSGSQANLAAYNALMNVGDKALALGLDHGGHLTHGHKVNITGKLYNFSHYGVRQDDELIDYDQMRELAIANNPRVIVIGTTAYPRNLDFQRAKQIADEVDAFLLADIAHISGLVAANVHPSPVGFADVITMSTHKTLRGPRGGMILWNNPDYTKKINSSIFPGTQGGPLMNIIAAKAQCYQEALDPNFGVYARQVVANAKAMCGVFEQNGFPVQTGGTDSHIILMDLSKSKHSGRQAADLLEANGITVNKNGVPNDPRNFVETSGIRIGTAAETTKGHDEEWFRNLADTICNILENNG